MAWLENDYPGQVDEAIAGLSALSALAVVSADITLREFRVNQAADEAHTLQPSEAEDLGRLLDSRPTWRP